jgi:ATP-binding cassette, subfamily C (CFTR/MRP), member 4
LILWITNLNLKLTGYKDMEKTGPVISEGQEQTLGEKPNAYPSIRFGEFLVKDNSPSWYDQTCFLSKILFIPSFQMCNYTNSIMKRLKKTNQEKEAELGRKLDPKEAAKIESSDLPALGSTYATENNLIDLNLAWAQELQKRRETPAYKPSFTKCMIHVFRPMLLQSAVYIFVANLMTLLYTICIRGILMAIKEEEETLKKRYFYALIFLALFNGFLMSFGYIKAVLFGQTAQGAITAMIYKKLHQVSLSSLQKLSTGKIINIVANDLQCLMQSWSLPGIFVIPFVLVYTVVVLWQFVGAYALLFFFSFFASLNTQKWAMKHYGKLLGPKLKATDTRVKVTNQLVNGIRLLKMYAWEDAFVDKILDARKLEHKAL